MADGPRETRPLGGTGPVGGDAWVSSRSGQTPTRTVSPADRERLRHERTQALSEALHEATDVLGRYAPGLSALVARDLDGEADRERRVAVHQFDEAHRLLTEGRQLLASLAKLSLDEALLALDRCPPERLLGALHPLHGFNDHFSRWPGCAGLFPLPRPGEGGGIGTRRLRTTEDLAMTDPELSKPVDKGFRARLRRWLGF
ncbi:MAG: hypothetical protein FJY99_00865 [Candidatus Sericytochromatia bacterium]|nr:hypothetical protein [Candidatus Tanganyikabacteria bacterium]